MPMPEPATTTPTVNPTSDDPRWLRIIARDRLADGEFWYSVATTGVYCRPSCPSRAAAAKNVRIHDSAAAARALGFRACLRCNPDGMSIWSANTALVIKACRLIEQAEQPPTLAALALAVELSPSYFHRLFTSLAGLSPRGYAAACRAGRLRGALGQAGSVTAAFHEAGFGSSGRFYEGATELLGMTPGRYRAGGAAEVLTHAVGHCSLGAMLVAWSGKGVAAILIGDDPDILLRDLQQRFRNARLVADDGRFRKRLADIVGLVEAPGRGLDLPLDIRGTVFQQKVWQALRRIPAGRTASYQEIAATIGAPHAVRAVAGACAANALAVVIPCHRVVRSDGGLSGYRWGTDRKRALLDREKLEE